jgi:hypothetical protein
MPYFITDDAEGCAGWATVKDDGTVMGCHGSKAGAIAQAVAIAQAEGSTFEGERAVRVLPVTTTVWTSLTTDVPEALARAER